MKQEMTGFGDGSGISWTICKQSASRSRQTTTSKPQHSFFTGQMLLLTLCPTNNVKAMKARNNTEIHKNAF